MKKIAAFILLVCLFFSFSGYHLYFFLRRQEVRAEMKEMLRSSIDNKNIKEFIFSFSSKDLALLPEWENHHEFRLNGEMYDVLEKRIEDGRILVRCISDKKETSLLKDYEKVNKDDFGNLNSHHRSALLLKLADNLYINNREENTHSSFTILSSKYLPFDLNIITPLYFDIPIPPPKVGIPALSC